jgi:hypothetical protein
MIVVLEIAMMPPVMPLRRKTLTGTSLKSVVESLLFVADAPLTLDRLCSILEEYERLDIRAAIDFCHRISRALKPSCHFPVSDGIVRTRLRHARPCGTESQA